MKAADVIVTAARGLAPFGIGFGFGNWMRNGWAGVFAFFVVIVALWMCD